MNCDKCKAFLELDSDYETVCFINEEWSECKLKEEEVEIAIEKETENLKKWIEEQERRKNNE